MEFRQSFISLRWILVILTCYLTVFSDPGPFSSAKVLVFALLFTLTNAALTLVPRRLFAHPRLEHLVTAADVVFLSIGFCVLGAMQSYLFLVFILVFLLTVIWRDLRVVLFSVGAVSVLYGFFSFSRIVQIDVGTLEDAKAEQAFLRLALLFVVSNFYVFLTARFKEEAHVAELMREETRRAAVMSEITCSLSSSLDSSEILNLIVTRLREVADAEDVSIVQLGSNSRSAEIVVRASEPHAAVADIDLADRPEMTRALESKDLYFTPGLERNGRRQSVIAVPMVVKEAVLGLIYIQLNSERQTLSDVETRFFKIMAGTAANALRNAQMFEEMERRARTDFLTGLPNHRFFQATLLTELARAQRHSRPLSLLMIDLDYLKEVNDRFGHPSGDSVIRVLADTIRQTCREVDFAARYGGEEFTVILPDTPLAAAVQVADRMREKMAAVQFPGMGNITASIGVSNYPLNAISREDLIRIADQALYIAKNGGRDRVAYFNYQLITRDTS